METSVSDNRPADFIPIEICTSMEQTEQYDRGEQQAQTNNFLPVSEDPKVFLVLFVKPLVSNEDIESASGKGIIEKLVAKNTERSKSVQILDQGSSPNHTVSSAGNGKRPEMTDSKKTVMRKRKKEYPEVVKTREGKRRRPRQAVPDDEKDEKYWEVRKKNTESARKCREKKKVTEEPDPVEELLGESDQMIQDLKDGRKAIEDFRAFIDHVMTIT